MTAVREWGGGEGGGIEQKGKKKRNKSWSRTTMW